MVKMSKQGPPLWLLPLWEGIYVYMTCMVEDRLATFYTEPRSEKGSWANQETAALVISLGQFGNPKKPAFSGTIREEEWGIAGDVLCTRKCV